MTPEQRAAELVDAAFREAEHQMDNYLPAEGESWSECRDRRLKAELVHRLASQPVPASSDLVAAGAEALHYANIPPRFRSQWPWGGVPESGKDQFRVMARAIIPIIQADEREDGKRLDYLQDESHDLCCFAIPTGAGDADIGWRVVGHWMAEPCERVVAEIEHDSVRDAIDAAIATAIRERNGHD